jgi:hypothetical protein
MSEIWISRIRTTMPSLAMVAANGARRRNVFPNTLIRVYPAALQPRALEGLAAQSSAHLAQRKKETYSQMLSVEFALLADHMLT